MSFWPVLGVLTAYAACVACVPIGIGLFGSTRNPMWLVLTGAGVMGILIIMAAIISGHLP